MGLTVILTRRSMLFLRAQRYAPSSIVEFVERYDLPSDGLSFGFCIPNTSNVNSSLRWQHWVGRPAVLVLTGSGGFRATFSLPCESLLHLILSARGEFTPAVRDWFHFWSQIDEAETNGILLATLYPEKADMILHACSQYASAQDRLTVAEHRELDPDRLPTIVAGFYCAVTRVVNPFWDARVLERGVKGRDGSVKWASRRFGDWFRRKRSRSCNTCTR
jgi:hypothetical protein